VDKEALGCPADVMVAAECSVIFEELISSLVTARRERTAPGRTLNHMLAPPSHGRQRVNGLSPHEYRESAGRSIVGQADIQFMGRHCSAPPLERCESAYSVHTSVRM